MIRTYSGPPEEMDPIEEPAEAPIEDSPIEDPLVEDPMADIPQTTMIDQMDVVYLPTEMGPFACGNCKYWGGDACTVVADAVDPGGWCMLFRPAQTEQSEQEMPLPDEGLPVEDAPAELPVEEPVEEEIPE